MIFIMFSYTTLIFVFSLVYFAFAYKDDVSIALVHNSEILIEKDPCSLVRTKYAFSPENVVEGKTSFNETNLRVHKSYQSDTSVSSNHHDHDLNIVHSVTIVNEYSKTFNLSSIRTGGCLTFLHDPFAKLTNIEPRHTIVLRFLFRPLVDIFSVNITLISTDQSNLIVQYRVLGGSSKQNITIASNNNTLLGASPQSPYFIDPTDKVFKIIVSSDPQPWRSPNSRDPNADQQCWLDDLKGFSWHEYVSSFAVVNGDLTEFGRYRTMRDGFSIFSYNKRNFFVGLGNHDYENNVNDCDAFPDLSENSCARSMVKYLWRSVKNQITTMPEFWFDATDDANAPSGSFAYGFPLGANFYLIQANNHPDYAVRLDHIFLPTINVHESFTQLKTTIRAVVSNRVDRRIILLNYHNCYYDVEKVRELYELAERRMIVFYGHSHQVSVDDLGNGLRAYNSGALFKRNFLAVHVVDRNLTVYEIKPNGTKVQLGQHYWK